MLYDFLKDFMKLHMSQLIEDKDTRITYRDLLRYAENQGKNLIYQKYGILCKSDLNTAKAMMSIFYAKKTAVILSYKYGEIHNQQIIKSMGLNHIITDDGIVDLDEDADETEDLSDVALIMCTSGTTGIPKGAMITERNLMTNLIDIDQYFKINDNDRILIARPLYHCAVLTGEFLISLIKGVHIYFISDGFAPDNIIGYVRKNNISVLCGTPTLFYYISIIVSRYQRPETLRTIAISGECMTQVVAQKIISAFGDIRIYNVYGLTEASPRASYLPSDEFVKYPLSVGYPLSSLKVKIVDKELCIRGNSIMKGYYKNKAASEMAIRDGWLHTGDIAEIDKDGRIFIKCRKDNLIIRSGMNIYPQEIENKLKTDKKIIDVLACGIRNENVSQRIKIKVVTNLSKSQVYDICKSKLPSFELPDEIEIVDNIPKNASGKIIRSGGQ